MATMLSFVWLFGVQRVVFFHMNQCGMNRFTLRFFMTWVIELNTKNDAISPLKSVRLVSFLVLNSALGRHRNWLRPRRRERRLRRGEEKKKRRRTSSLLFSFVFFCFVFFLFFLVLISSCLCLRLSLTAKMKPNGHFSMGCRLRF